METIEKKKKGKHKKCLNHPDKIAWRNGLCYKCNKEILHNKCKDSDMLPDEVKKVDERLVVKLCTDCKYHDVPNGQQPCRSCDDDGKNWQGKEPVLPAEWGQVDGKPFKASIINLKEELLEEAKKEEPVAIKKYEVWELEEDGYKTSIYISPDYRFIESVLVGLPDEYDYKAWMFLGKVSREIEKLAKS